MEKGIFKRNNAKGTIDKGVAKSTIHMISKGVPDVNKLGVTFFSQSCHQLVKKSLWSPNYQHVVTKWDQTLVPNE